MNYIEPSFTCGWTTAEEHEKWGYYIFVELYGTRAEVDYDSSYVYRLPKDEKLRAEVNEYGEDQFVLKGVSSTCVGIKDNDIALSNIVMNLGLR